MPFDDPACFRLDRIAVRPIHWLWRPYLAYGKLAILDGDPAHQARGPVVLAMVRIGRAGRRRTRPMSRKGARPHTCAVAPLAA